jgi:hypothetical protein
MNNVYHNGCKIALSYRSSVLSCIAAMNLSECHVFWSVRYNRVSKDSSGTGYANELAVFHKGGRTDMPMGKE